MWRIGLLATVVLLWLPGAATAAPACTFQLGFAALAAALPQVGACLDDESHNPANGDALQRTTGGLLVWRKADNWTAFTDGYRTWVAGPYGVQERLNSQRFAWEATGAGPAQPLAGVVIVPDDGAGTAPGCRTDPRTAVPLEAAFGAPAPYVGRCVDVSAYADGPDMPTTLADYGPPSDPIHFPLYVVEGGQASIIVLDLTGYPDIPRVKSWLIHGAQGWAGGMPALVVGVLTGASGPVYSVRPVRIQGAGCTFAAAGYGPATC